MYHGRPIRETGEVEMEFYKNNPLVLSSYLIYKLLLNLDQEISYFVGLAGLRSEYRVPPCIILCGDAHLAPSAPLGSTRSCCRRDRKSVV